jgi:hypothetical protein
MADKPPANALFIRWGKFQADAFGVPAIVLAAMIVTALWAEFALVLAVVLDRRPMRIRIMHLIGAHL